MKLNPKCLSSNPRETKGAAYTSDGYMLPCCWLDDPPVYRYIKECGLKDEKLLLSNNSCLEDIFTSDQWENFFQILLNEPEKTSYMCKKKCGVDFTEEETAIRWAEEKSEVERERMKSYGKNY